MDARQACYQLSYSSPSPQTVIFSIVKKSFFNWLMGAMLNCKYLESVKSTLRSCGNLTGVRLLVHFQERKCALTDDQTLIPG